MHKLFDSTDYIDFGQNEGEQFYWIYRLNIDYFEWIIEKTDICFSNLELFKQYGNPINVNFNILSEKKKELVINKCEKLSKNNYSGRSKSYNITIGVLDEILEDGIIKLNDLNKKEYFFPEKLIEINSEKLKHSVPCSNLDFSKNKTRKNSFGY